MYIPNDPTLIAAVSGALVNLTEPWNWQQRGTMTPRTASELMTKMVFAYLNSTGCEPGDIPICTDYLLNDPIIDIQPADPFTDPDEVPDGYLAAPFHVVDAGDGALLLLGYQVGDIQTDLTHFPSGSLPTIIPPDGFARFRVTFTGAAQVLFEMLQIPFGGIVSFQTDNDITTVQTFDLNLDVVALPPENDISVIQEIIVAGDGEHWIDVTFLPVANDEIPFVGYGGGARRVTICQEGQFPMPGIQGVRTNPADECVLQFTEDGETWVDFAQLDDCGPIFRIGPDGTPQVSYNDGGSWESFPYELPPITPREGTETDNRCLAAANAVEMLRSMQGEVTQNVTERTLLMIATSLGVFVASLLFFPLAPIAIIGVFTPAIVGIIQSVGLADFTEAVADELRCILFCAATDVGGVVTFDFGQVQSGVDASSIASDMKTLIGAYLEILGSDGLNLAGATPTITEADCTDCIDCPEFCEDYLDPMTAALGPKTQISDGSPHGAGAIGTWVDGLGRTGGGAVQGVTFPGYNKLCGVVVDLGQDCLITYTSIWHYRENAGGVGTFNHTIYNEAEATVFNYNATNVNPEWEQYQNSVLSVTGRYLLYFWETNVSNDIRLDDIIIGAS